jgi:SPP1 family phage portal protein
VNEFEGFVHAYMVFEGLVVDEKTIQEANRTGAFAIPPGGTGTKKISFLTKDVNDSFSEHQLDRLEDNIYRFSKTPNLNDETFGTASGVSLKFKLNGLNAKCGMFQAKMMDAAVYMWKLLASHWAKKSIVVDPLQVTMEFSRDFPLDTLSNAQAAQALIAAGLPKEVAWAIAVPEIDDIDYVLQLVEAEKNDIPPITADDEDDEYDDTNGVGEE